MIDKSPPKPIARTKRERNTRSGRVSSEAILSETRHWIAPLSLSPCICTYAIRGPAPTVEATCVFAEKYQPHGIWPAGQSIVCYGCSQFPMHFTEVLSNQLQSRARE